MLQNGPKTAFLGGKQNSCGRHRNFLGGQRRQHPGWIRVPAVLAESQGVCTFSRRKKKSNITPQFAMVQVFSEFETTKSFRPKATGRRSCCDLTVSPHGSYQGCSAEDHGSEDPVCSLAGPCSCRPFLLWYETSAHVRKNRVSP